MAEAHTIFKHARVRTQTLGCKLNFAETATLCDQIVAAGARVADPSEEATLCIINTCSVTDTADHKCRQAIHRMQRANPHALMVVMGCYAQLKPREVAAIDGVDVVLGTEQKAQAFDIIASAWSKAMMLRESEHSSTQPLSSLKEEAGEVHISSLGRIASFAPSCSRGNRTRYFLKVQDGCDYFCTYCAIPFARGRSRSASIASIVEQAKGVAAAGGKEIVLTGVNTGDFGRGTNETFLQLIRALDQVEGIARYRISSIEPNLLTQEVIDFCASSRAFMPHFHIPLQSGSDAVLRLMKRRYDTAFFADKVQAVLKAMPDAFIGIDVIVGTRGETADYFEETRQFLSQLPFAQLHVFTYSERAGTQALQIPHIVHPEEKHARCQQLLALSEQKLRTFYQQHIGTTRPVLWEQAAHRGTTQQGFTDNYIRCELLPDQSLRNDTELRAEHLDYILPSGHVAVG